jgi:pilus assembly protein CpaF
MTSTLNGREEQQQRARSDFESAIGDDLAELLARDDVNDVNIRPNGRVIFQQSGRGRIVHPDLRYSPDDAEILARSILQCLNPVPEMNEQQQAVDCKLRLADDSHFARVHIDSPPSVSAMQICIRKQMSTAPTFEDGWVKPGYMHPDFLDVMRWTVEARKNVIFCGKMYTGKTTCRNSHFDLMHRLDPNRGLAEIMDVNETIVKHDDYSPLFITPSRSAADHCMSFMRMSQEAVGINELRGGQEAYQLVHNLWLSGHDGSSTTMHAEKPDEALWRLRTLIEETNRTANLEVLAKAVHVLVFLRYAPSIGRRVTEIVHIKGVDSAGHVRYENLGPKIEWPAAVDSTEYRSSAA